MEKEKMNFNNTSTKSVGLKINFYEKVGSTLMGSEKSLFNYLTKLKLGTDQAVDPDQKSISPPKSG